MVASFFFLCHECTCPVCVCSYSLSTEVSIGKLSSNVGNLTRKYILFLFICFTKTGE